MAAAAATGKCQLHLHLIESVREHEVLYNCDVKDYSDNILKMRLWRKIARQCDIGSGEEAKKIWKNLRDGFRCSLKTLKCYEKKEPPRPLKPWKYFDEMVFLKPYMKDRIFTNSAYYEADTKSEDNTSFSGGDGDVQEEIECKPDVTALAQQELLNQYDDFDKDDRSLSLHLANVQAMRQLDANFYKKHPHHFHTAPELPPRPKKRGRKRKVDIDLVPQHQSAAVNMKNVSSGETKFNGQSTLEMNDGEDSLKLFFESMYSSTKALPVPLQRLVRIKLFQTVTDAEMAAETMAMDNIAQSVLNHSNNSK